MEVNKLKKNSSCFDEYQPDTTQKQTYEHNEKTFTWNDVKLITIYGRAIKQTNISSIAHSHSQYEMFVVESGNGYLVVNDKKYRFSRNTAVIIPPNVEHARYITENVPVTEMSIFFKYKKASTYQNQNNEKLYDMFEALMPKDDNIIVLRDKYFGEFNRTFFSETESNPILASSLITNLLQTLFLKSLRILSKVQEEKSGIPIYSYKSTSLSNDLILIREIETYLSLYPNCKLSELANHLQMCTRNTQRVVKKLFGKSFSEISADNRLKRAKVLMETKDYSLTEIARRVNYNQYASFRKAFIAKFGITPSEYREKSEM